MSVRLSSRAVWLSSAAALALCAPAAAKDLPATPDGAKTISAFVTTFGGKAAAGPAVSVTPEGADYLVSFDIGALTAALKPMGDTYAPATLKYKVFQQDDGAWRVEQSDLPPISGESHQGDKTAKFTLTAAGLKTVMVLDPALSWLRGVDGRIDSSTVNVEASGLDEKVNVGAVTAVGSSKRGTDGAVATTLAETVKDLKIALKIDPKAANPTATGEAQNVAITSAGLDVGVNLGGLQTKALLDLWAFLVAHPTRPELAADEVAFKTLLTAAASGQPSFDETLGAKSLSVDTSKGVVGAASFTFGVGGAAAGSASRFEERFAAADLKLPDAIVPAIFRDLVPTTFDIGVKVTGFDANAAAAEAIADMHLAGDGPPIAKEDQDKVFARLLSAGPVTIDISPSHVVAPQLDIAFEGKILYASSKPTGAVTVHMKNFDSTVSALKGLGPDTEKQMVPVLAMAKGLAKTEPDGSLSWIGEVGADGVMKVNGLPLGKAPF